MIESDLDIAIITATAERLAEKIKPRADEAEKKFRYMRWLEGDDGRDHGSEYCTECASEVAKNTPGGPWGVDGWDETFERDGPAYCDKCGCPLLVSLTSYGEEEEWAAFAEADYTPQGPDWYHLAGMLRSVRCMEKPELDRILPHVLTVFEKLEAIDG